MHKRKKSRSSKPMPPWLKKNIPIWLEIKDNSGHEIENYLSGFVKDIMSHEGKVKVLLNAKNEEVVVPANLVLQRTLDHKQIYDLIDIPVLNNAELLAHLHMRYIADQIYCYCGPSLIAVNPYRHIEHTESKETYDNIVASLERKKLDSAVPHVWTVSATAYEALVTYKKKQAICVNGESGAGKTESTKRCLEFLTSLDHSKNRKETNSLSSKILACNPILEAFGNSKTTRNDNSSRFGKYVKLYYNLKNNVRIMGSLMENYLLEKSRVVSIAKNERSFHIFYAMCLHMPFPLQKKYHLINKFNKCDPSLFNYLSASGVYQTPKLDDKEIYDEVIEAFKQLEFSDVEQDAIWRMLSAILHLGNIEFDESYYVDGAKPVRILQNEDYKKVLSLLECDSEQMQEAFTLKIRQVHNQVFKTPHRPEQVKDYINSFSKELYRRLFNWIFKKLNNTLKKNLPSSIVDKTTSDDCNSDIQSIGILDIFGFEIFDKNYLNQLFINYANERLQGLYIDHVFKNECKLFQKQGLDSYINLIVYEDNIDLIKILDATKSISIFGLTNQISTLNKRDENLMNEFQRNFKPNNNKYIKFHKIKDKIFYIKHTARDVEYDINGFIETNKDEISSSLLHTLESCKPSIKNIYYEVVNSDEIDENEQNKKIIPTNTKFLAINFTSNMDGLIKELKSSQLYFIRCIKPNELKKPEPWNGQLVLRQIMYMGLLDSLNIRKNNYPIRYKYKEFYREYQDLDLHEEGHISFATLEAKEVNWKHLSQQLLNSTGINYNEKEILLGTTKILMNEPLHAKLNDKLKIVQQNKKEALMMIEKFYRSCKQRHKIQQFFNSQRNAIVLAKSVLSDVNAKVEYVKFKKSIETIRKLQINFKKTMKNRTLAHKVHKSKLIAQFFSLKKFADTMKTVSKRRKAVEFARIRLKYIIYKNRKKIVQRILNKIFDRSWYMIKYKEVDKAAIDIQRHLRAHFLRNKFRNQISNIDKKVENFKTEQAIIAVQSLTRRFLVQKRFSRINGAARKIQGFFKTLWMRRYFLLLKKSTIMVQRATRKWFLRNKVIEQKFKEIFGNIGDVMQNVQFAEYETLFGQLNTELKMNDLIDYEYFKLLKKGTSVGLPCYRMIPDPPSVELNPRSKLFALPVDVSMNSDSLLIYENTWAKEVNDLMNKLNNEESRLLHMYVGESFSLAISDDLKVYTWGSNDSLQLARETVSSFGEKADVVKSLSCNKPLQIALGKDHGCCLTQTGHVFLWGDNKDGQLGQGHSRFVDSIVVLNDLEKPVKQIAIDGNTTYLVNKDGSMIFWPYSGQLGSFLRKEVYLSLGEKIDSISVGGNFVMLTSTRGLLYSMGDNNLGQLGIGDFVERKNPTILTYFSKTNERIVEVSCGYKHVVCRSAMGKIYVWGMNTKHQLGSVHRESRNLPQVLSLDNHKSHTHKIKSVQAGFASTYVLLEDNSLFVCGKCGLGTLTTLARLPYEQKFFKDKMNKNFVPLRLNCSWSNMLSILYISILDFRDTGPEKHYKDKIGTNFNTKWSQKGNILPDSDDALLKYIQTKNFNKVVENNSYIDLKYNQSNVLSATRPQSLLSTDEKHDNDTIMSRYKPPKVSRANFEKDNKVKVTTIKIDEKDEVIGTDMVELPNREIKRAENRSNNKNKRVLPMEKDPSYKNSQQALIDIFTKYNDQVEGFKNNDDNVFKNEYDRSIPQQSLQQQRKSSLIKKPRFSNIDKKNEDMCFDNNEAIVENMDNQYKPSSRNNNIQAIAKSHTNERSSLTTGLTKKSSYNNFIKNKNGMHEKKDKIYDNVTPDKKNSNRKLLTSKQSSKVPEKQVQHNDKDKMMKKVVSKASNLKSDKSIDKHIKGSKVLQNSNIFEEVEKIMKKDPAKWNKVDKEIVNNYIKLTSNFIK